MPRDREKLMKAIDSILGGGSVAYKRGAAVRTSIGVLLDTILGAVGGKDPQESVKDRAINDPPVSPADGDRYITGGSPTGAWAGQAQAIAEWDGAEWDFTVPTEGMFAWVESENSQYSFDGSVWVKTLALDAIHEHVYNVVPAGLVNGTNTAFTLPSAPNPAESLMLHKNGLLMRQGVGNDFVLSGLTVTFETAQVPQVGDIMLASYSTLP